MIDYTQYKPPDCSKCPLWKAPGPVWGVGDPQRAELFYIAQNPGKTEVEATPMQPLIGPSGNVFELQLRKAGLTRGNFYITNQVKCLTPGNREPSEREVACCRPLIDKELARARADTVILAGAVAFKANIGRYSTLSPAYHPSDSIFERMGCVEQRDGRKWIGTIHPAFVMRMPNFRDEAIRHLQKAWAIAGVKLPLPRIIERPTQEDIARHKEAARRNRLFADDVECLNIPVDMAEDDYVGKDEWRMDICGFSAIPNEAIVLDANQLADAWSDVWADPTITQAEHNGESDRYHLERVAPQLNDRWDTMLAHHFLHNISHKYLKPECVREYTNLPYYERDLEKVNRRLYNGMDNIVTLIAAQKQIRAMEDDVYRERDGTLVKGRLLGLFNGGAFPGEPPFKHILPILEEQRRLGARTNIRQALLFKKVLTVKVSKAEAIIAQMLGPFFNWRSPDQVKMLYYGPTAFADNPKKTPPGGIKSWYLPIQTIKVKGKTHVTTNERARENLKRWIKAKPERMEVYKQAWNYFQLQDFVSENSKLLEYIDRIEPDQRVHSFWKAHGSIGFRLASKPNFQNWPTWPIASHKDPQNGKVIADLPSMRSLVIADDDDDALVTCDFDQVELWTYAAIFQIKYLLDIYKRGDYIYGAAYEQVFKKPFFQEGKPRTKKYKGDWVTEEELLRAKAVPLGFLYGRAGESVAAEHGWPSIEGVRYKNDWFGRNPELPQAHNWIQLKMRNEGVLRPPPGWLLHFPQPDLQGVNCFGQSPAAAMLWTSMILIDHEFKRRNYTNTRIILSVHDSMTFNIGGGRKYPENTRQVVEDVIWPVLRRPVPWLGGFRYKHSTKVGNMWDWEMLDYEQWLEKHGA